MNEFSWYMLPVAEKHGEAEGYFVLKYLIHSYKNTPRISMVSFVTASWIGCHWHGKKNSRHPDSFFVWYFHKLTIYCCNCSYCNLSNVDLKGMDIWHISILVVRFVAAEFQLNEHLLHGITWSIHLGHHRTHCNSGTQLVFEDVFQAKQVFEPYLVNGGT